MSTPDAPATALADVTNSLSRSRSSSNASNGRGRPLPVLPVDTSGTKSGASGPQKQDGDSDSDTGRHSSSSKPRTQFTVHTPAAEKAAMHNLKTKMTFSDNSAPSSTASTPSKPTQPHFPLLGLPRGAMTDPSKLRNSLQPGGKKSGTPVMLATRLSAAVPGDDDVSDDQSDEFSEGEITSSVTISALLSKLDSVRNFLKEAESLRKRFETKVSEAGVSEQMDKLDMLIAELRQQEASHLGLLSAVMAESELSSLGAATSDNVKAARHIRKKERELSEGEVDIEDESEGDSEESDEDDPANQTVIRVMKDHDDSLSLRAQVEERRQHNARQEEELAVLRQQQELLRKLLTQQRRIQELELRQAALLKMKERAEEQIAEAEAESDKMQQRLTEDAGEGKEEYGETGQPKSPAGSGQEEESGAATLATAGGEDTENQTTLNGAAESFEPSSISQEKLLLMKLAEVKARKEKVEQLVSLLTAMRSEDAAMASDAASPKKEEEEEREGEGDASTRKEQPQVATPPHVAGGNSIGLSSEALGRDGGRSELVDDREISRMAELHERMQKADEARKKLRTLQDMIAQLHIHSPDISDEEDNPPSDQLQWRLGSKGGDGRGQLGVALSDGEESDDEAEEEGELAGDVTLNTTLTEDFDPAEQSVLEEYQQRLEAKRQEVAELQRQRDELRRTQERLFMFKSRMMDSEQDNLLAVPKAGGRGQPRRTRQGAEEKAADTTTATWGGSTLASEIEGEKSPASSTSLPSAIFANVTQDPNVSALAGSASVEERGASQGKPPFKVTRHTPRTVPIHRSYRMRTISSPADQTQTKRRKLDTQNMSTASWQPAQDVPRPANPNPYTAAAHFESPLAHQTNQLNTSHMTTDSSHCHTSLLHSQLALTSNMCSELLHTQSSLVGAVCSHLEVFGYQVGIQQQMAMISRYQRELEQYYHELYRSYAQIAHHHPAHNTSRSTEAQSEEHVSSMTNQQLDETQASTERASSGVVKNNEMSEGGAQAGAAKVTPPPFSTQPQIYHIGVHPGQQMVPGGDVGLATLPAPPIPPPTFNPYEPPFHSTHPYYGGSRSHGNTPSPFGMGFGPPRFAPGGYPRFAPPMPHPLPGHPYTSPTSYPRHLHWGHHSAGAPVFGSPSQGPQFAPPPSNGAPPYPMLHPAHLQAHPPFAPLPVASLNTSLTDRGGLASSRPSSLLPSQAHLLEERFGFNSPSGVTASSLQVQPPSSPTSAPSVNYQQNSSNQNNCNATSTAMPKFVTAQLPATGMTSSAHGANLMGGTLQYPSFPLAGTAFPLAQASFVPGGRGMTDNSDGQFTYLAASKPVAEDMAATASGGVGAYSGSMVVDGGQRELEEASESSLPVSLPEELSNLQLDTLEGELMLQSEGQQPGGEDGGGLTASNLPSGFSVFDALRDTIYSEVATLIANNESRPHFLVELFRELQMLTTDYLRQRALYNLQDLVTRYLTEEGVAEEAKAIAESANLFQGWAAGSVSEHTPSENGLTTEEDEASKPPLVKTNSQKYDYVEPVNSASSLSTPPNSSLISDDQPFASESLGATAVRLDKTMAKVKGEVVIGGDDRGSPFRLKPPVVSPGPLKTGDEMAFADVNAQQLDELIKMIMIEVIPIFKKNLESHCTLEILTQIKQVVVGLLAEQEDIDEQKQELFAAFTKQLETAINSAVDKYKDKPLKECGEDLLVEISEVLFNELTFFRILKDFRGHPQLNSELDITTSQSTTENEDYEGEEKPRLFSQEAAARSGRQPLDPALLEALCLAATANLAQEEEALGNSRDDDLAASWDVKMQERDHASLSIDEDAPMKVVELSLSESQPFDSTGSGEEDGGDIEASYVIIDECAPAHLQDNDQKEATPTPVGKEQQLLPTSMEALSTEQHGETGNDQAAENSSQPSPKSDGGDAERGGETPPTPQAEAEVSTETVPTSDEAERGGGEGVEARNGGGGGDVGGGAPVSASSPADSGESTHGSGEVVGSSVEGEGVESAPPTDNQIELKGIDEVALEAQMKKEEDKTGGVAGILASIEETGIAELAGDGNELATPTSEYVEP